MMLSRALDLWPSTFLFLIQLLVSPKIDPRLFIILLANSRFYIFNQYRKDLKKQILSKAAGCNLFCSVFKNFTCFLKTEKSCIHDEREHFQSDTENLFVGSDA